MPIQPNDLVSPLRAAITATALVCALLFWRRLRSPGPAAAFDRALGAWLAIMLPVAALFTHTRLFGNGAAFLPFGVAPGFALAIASLWWPAARQRFDRLPDGDVRLLMSFRAIFGAFIFAGAGLGLFPAVFAVTAGLGDLLAGWLATVAGGGLDARGARPWRWLVHGWGALDLFDVAALGTLVVTPWIVETGSPGPSLLLPWVCVPLLLALNLHGLRAAWRGSGAA